MRPALALTLALVACNAASAAEQQLAAEGFSGIAIGPQSGDELQFTATKDGAACSGTITVEQLAP